MDPAPVASEVCSPGACALLRLTMVDGLGPTLIARARLRRPRRRAPRLRRRPAAAGRAKESPPDPGGLDGSDAAPATNSTSRTRWVFASWAGRRRLSPAAQTPASPPVLYVRARLDPRRDLFGVGIVGSRRASHYGVEQTDRFSLALAQAGLTVVSGGARGVDTAAHRAALRAQDGRTVAVLGCGLATCYPPENAELFAQIADSGGAVISELPLRTGPSPENFPARNRIISGMSLGVLVVEAPAKSGALITARYAAEDQGREVMALPGRVDWDSAEGTNELLKSGAAAMVTTPRDVIDILENAARHAHHGTHGARARGLSSAPDDADDLFATTSPAASASLTDRQRLLLEALGEGETIDRLVEATGLDAGQVLAEATVLEIRGLIARRGDRFERATVAPKRMPSKGLGRSTARRSDSGGCAACMFGRYLDETPYIFRKRLASERKPG